MHYKRLQYEEIMRRVMEPRGRIQVIVGPRGRYVESAVGAYLVSYSQSEDYKVYYWREGAEEVDFVLLKGRKKVAIEIKTGRRPINSGMVKFKETFHPYRTVVVGTGGLGLEEFFSMPLHALF